jgi:putative membrane protein (TIGR04086 family)
MFGIGKGWNIMEKKIMQWGKGFSQGRTLFAKKSRPRGTKEESAFPGVFLLKCLLFAYILTGALLLVLALLLYRLGLSEKMVSAGIIVIYVAATFFAGFLAGKRLKSRKFLWGLALGCAYFLILVLVSLVVNRSLGELADSFFSALLLCAGGGMLGGMLS